MASTAMSNGDLGQDHGLRPRPLKLSHAQLLQAQLLGVSGGPSAITNGHLGVALEQDRSGATR